MRSWLLLALAVCAIGCTKDYGAFRYPRGTAPAADGGSHEEPDTGSHASSDAAPDGD